MHCVAWEQDAHQVYPFGACGKANVWPYASDSCLVDLLAGLLCRLSVASATVIAAWTTSVNALLTARTLPGAVAGVVACFAIFAAATVRRQLWPSTSIGWLSGAEQIPTRAELVSAPVTLAAPSCLRLVLEPFATSEARELRVSMGYDDWKNNPSHKGGGSSGSASWKDDLPAWARRNFMREKEEKESLQKRLEEIERAAADEKAAREKAAAEAEAAAKEKAKEEREEARHVAMMTHMTKMVSDTMSAMFSRVGDGSGSSSEKPQSGAKGLLKRTLLERDPEVEILLEPSEKLQSVPTSGASRRISGKSSPAGSSGDACAAAPVAKKARLLEACSSEEEKAPQLPEKTGHSHEDYIKAGNQVLKCLKFKETASRYPAASWPDNFIYNVAKNSNHALLKKVCEKNLKDKYDSSSTKQDTVKQLLNFALGN